MTPGRSATAERVRYVWHNGRAVLAARWYLRHADIVGARVRLRGRPSIQNHGRMIIGARVQLVSTVATLELVTMEGGTLEVGERTLLNYGSSIAAAEHIRIGARCLIGTHAIIMDNDFHRIEPERRLEWPKSRPIIIGDNVWVGARVIVLGGVTIGDDSCIGAGSVVVDDVPPRTLAAGVPARVIRSL
jgi:acetyltransferase-like isoleucine patch superfamily enzyme